MAVIFLLTIKSGSLLK